MADEGGDGFPCGGVGGVGGLGAGEVFHPDIGDHLHDAVAVIEDDECIGDHVGHFWQAEVIVGRWRHGWFEPTDGVIAEETDGAAVEDR